MRPFQLLKQRTVLMKALRFDQPAVRPRRTSSPQQRRARSDGATSNPSSPPNAKGPFTGLFRLWHQVVRTRCPKNGALTERSRAAENVRHNVPAARRARGVLPPMPRTHQKSPKWAPRVFYLKRRQFSPRVRVGVVDQANSRHQAARRWRAVGGIGQSRCPSWSEADFEPCIR